MTNFAEQYEHDLETVQIIEELEERGEATDNDIEMKNRLLKSMMMYEHEQDM